MELQEVVAVDGTDDEVDVVFSVVVVQVEDCGLVGVVGVLAIEGVEVLDAFDVLTGSLGDAVFYVIETKGVGMDDKLGVGEDRGVAFDMCLPKFFEGCGLSWVEDLPGMAACPIEIGDDFG